MTRKVLVLPGDGIGPEIVQATVAVLKRLDALFGLGLEMEEGLIGGAATDATGSPYPEQTQRLAHEADAVLLGAVGGPKWEALPKPQRPEAGLLAIRKDLELFANLRPARIFPELADASTLKREVIEGVDLIVVRELVSGIYFGEPRGIFEESGERKGVNTLVYREHEIARIARVAFETARKRRRDVVSVDKANVLEATELWREVVGQVHADYPDVRLRHMYVDNAAMQLVRDPRQFDVIVTTNMFGDILSDEAAMLTGSIGMLPSASLGERHALYEPVHGSAPDIAGRGIANPIATMLSAAMMLRFSLGAPEAADALERAVERALADGVRTPDLGGEAGTMEVARAVMQRLEEEAR